MFFIGDVSLDNRVLSAPLAGVTDKAFRIIIKSFGCGLVFSEMISDKGLVYDQERTHQIADISDEVKPVAIQIFGAEPEYMARAAVIVQEKGADIIDINMGCPAPKVVKNGEGSALMLDIPRSRQIIRQVVKAVKVPVTIKMRRGWDKEDSCMELAAAACEEGAKAITVHPRSRGQFYSGKADWDIIRAVKRIANIPVIGNGDIWIAQDAVRMMEETACDAVMIARGAMGNPFIFRETIDLLEHGRRIDSPSVEERMKTAVKHLDLAIGFKGEKVAVREMRKHMAWYTKGLRAAAKFREMINMADTRDEMLEVVKLIKAANDHK